MSNYNFKINDIKDFKDNFIKPEGLKDDLTLEVLQTNKFLQYSFYNKFKEMLQNEIKKKDKDHLVTRVKEKTIIDPSIYDSIEFKDKFKIFNEKCEEFKTLHPEYYRKQPSLPNTEYIKDYIPGNLFILSLEVLCKHYKVCNYILKNIDNSELDKFCTEEKLMLNYEYRPIYEEYKEQIRRELDLPSNEELIHSYYKIETVVNGPYLDRTKPLEEDIIATESCFDNAITNILKNI